MVQPVPEKIQQDYNVVPAYPTYLFFTSDGKVVHRIVGAKTIEKFRDEAAKAFDPEKQFYTILTKYERGVLDTSELKRLALELRSSEKVLSDKLAIAYLEKIPVSSLGRQDVLQLLYRHSKNVEVQKYAAKYLQLQSGEVLRNPQNSLLINFFKESKVVQDVVLNYLDQLSMTQLKVNMPLLEQFSDVQKAKEIGSKYLSKLSKCEFYTAENLILLSKFTNSVDDPGFQVFYDSNSAKTVEAIIRKKRGYENADAKKIAGDIFVTGNLSKDFFESQNPESFDWDNVAMKYKGKFDDEFLNKNILNARVQALKILTSANEKFWPDYIKYNIQLCEKYGLDTSSAFVDANYTNNFVYDGIFMHSRPLQISIGLKWMEGVVRRNPNEANLLDTYANLLYKGGMKVKAIEWQAKSCGYS